MSSSETAWAPPENRTCFSTSDSIRFVSSSSSVTITITDSLWSIHRPTCLFIDSSFCLAPFQCNGCPKRKDLLNREDATLLLSHSASLRGRVAEMWLWRDCGALRHSHVRESAKKKQIFASFAS